MVENVRLLYAFLAMPVALSFRILIILHGVQLVTMVVMLRTGRGYPLEETSSATFVLREAIWPFGRVI